MNRIRIMGISRSLVPDAVFADWKVYSTGKASGMFGAGGRGSFATRFRDNSDDNLMREYTEGRLP